METKPNRKHRTAALEMFDLEVDQHSVKYNKYTQRCHVKGKMSSFNKGHKSNLTAKSMPTFDLFQL